MTTFPGSPRIIKGALVTVDLFNPLASVVIFQYNPENLSRNLTPQISQRGQHFVGPPQEQISVSVEVNAVDQLERADSIATTMGIYPQLSALEMMLYPKSSAVMANMVLANLGTIEIVPPASPLTIFVWGVKRVVPVSLANLAIEEQAFDINLNPIRAKVDMGLKVLNYNDFPILSAGNGLFMVHQITKEVMAVLGSTGNVQGLVDSVV